MIVINGRFLTQQITGVQRFAYEIVKELDKIVDKKNILLVYPKNQKLINNLNLKNIKIVGIGNLTGHFWEQLELPIYAIKNRAKILTLANSAPIIKTDITTIHDIQPKVHPEFFSKKYVFIYRILNWINIKMAKKIITVSNFSRSEIVKYYGVSENKITVIYNGWEHMDRIQKDDRILDKLKVKNIEYILGVSSMNPNKNFKYILGLAELHPEYKFVIVGKKNSDIFKDGSVEELQNLTWAGYVTDEELKALYSSAKAFVFPSFYEGFGIPPLEAIASGCQNIFVSNTSCLPNIYEKNVNYINPNRIKKIILKNKDDERIRILEKYSWKKNAQKIEEIIKLED